MNKKIQLFIYIDGVNDIPFYGVDFEEFHVDNTEFVTSDGFVLNVVHSNEQIELYDFTYDAKRMGDAPTISATLMYDQCLDSIWSDNIYALFNGEKFFLKQTPTSSYSNDDSRYKHELALVSERYILNNVYFYDVVASDVENDRPISNSSNVTFFGDIQEFAKRFNYSLQYAKLQILNDNGEYESGYRVIVDEGVETEGKLIAFDNAFMANALQEVYNTFNVPYYFVGKDIHIGDSPNKIETIFKYGVDDALLSITKNNANFKVVNRATGIGSIDNIPYYYPNQTERGDISVLLNGEEGKAYIYNVSKFSNFSLIDELKYKHKAKYYRNYADNVYLYGLSKYDNLSYQESLKRSDFNVYCKFDFIIPELEEMIPVEFEMHNRDNRSASYRFICRNSTNNQIIFNQGATKASYGTEVVEDMFLSAGRYTIEINVHFYTTEQQGPINISLSELRNYFDTYWKPTIVQQSSESSYWSKDDLWINLNEYGVKINDGIALKSNDTLTLRCDKYVQPQTNLMPCQYRNTSGSERFYPAVNDTYIIPGTNEYYTFENQYENGHPKEQIVEFEDIKPTIVGIKNASGELIGMFSEFAYDKDDNDETEEIDGTLHYKHPYFFGKLRKFDGENGFNLFDHSIEESEMVVSFTDGSCGGCEFTIVVSEGSQENLVQIYEQDTYDKDGVLHKKGDLVYDINGNVLCGREIYQSAVVAQDVQNDTRNNEVWVALRKDDATFGVLMPNAKYNYKPKASTIDKTTGLYMNDGDKFVILHIDLPQAYIDAAEKRLEDAIINYMAHNNNEKFNFSIAFSRIYLAEHPEILQQLDENSYIQIEYNNHIYPLYVSGYSFKASSSDALPEISIELKDTLTITKNALQNAISEAKSDMFTVIDTLYNQSSTNAEDSKFQKKYIRKDIADTVPYATTFESGVKLGEDHYVSGNGEAKLSGIMTDDKKGVVQSSMSYNSDPLLGYGYGIEQDDDGSYKLTIDRIVARQSLTVTELVIQEYSSVSGALVVSHANGVLSNVKTVLIDGIEYYQLFLKDWGINSLFEVGDFIRCSKFDRKTTNLGGYWVEIADVEPTQGFIVARKSDFAHTPEIQDVIVQFGSTNPHRQGLVLISVEDAKPRIDAYDGINSTDQNSLKNALKSRFGRLDGIVDNGTELSGYGVYTDKLYIGIGENLSTKFTVLEDSISLTVNGLKGTGIDIENKKVTITADNFVVQNQDGIQTALVDENGKLSTKVIDADKLFIQRIIALDKNVTPHQVVSTINVIENDGFYYTHYPVSYNSNGEPISGTVYKVVEGYNIGYPASANGYNAETDSIATVYDAYGNVRWRLVIGDGNTFGVVGVGDKWEPVGLRLLSESTSTDADILENDYEGLEYPTSVSFSKDSNGKWVATPTYNSYEVLIPLAYKQFVPGANSAYESYRSFVKSWDGNSNSLKNDYTFVGTLTGKYLTTSKPIQSAIIESASIRRVTVSYTWEIEVYENGQYIQTLRTSRGYICDY